MDFSSLGNHALFLLTRQSLHELRVDLRHHNGTERYAKYSRFAVASECKNFTLTAQGYTGDAGELSSNYTV
jgi:hypothetical protein